MRTFSRSLARAPHLAAAAGLSGAGLLGAVRLSGDSHVPWLLRLAVPVALLFALCGLGLAVLDRRSQTYLRAFTVATVGLLLCQLWFGLRGEISPSTAVLSGLLATMSCACILGLGPRASLAVAGLCGLAHVAMAMHTRDLLTALVEGVALFAAGLVTREVGSILLRASDELETATTNLWRTRDAQARRRFRADAADRIDGQVHDTVLAALLLVGKARSPRDDVAAAHLADEALAIFDEDHRRIGGRPWGDAVQQHARRLGLDLTMDVVGAPVDPDVSEAITAATIEALSNVARHSGQEKAGIVAVFEADRFRIVVNDPGEGFDPDKPRVGRAGIDTSIIGRLSRVGAEANVDSWPGSGTTIMMEGPSVVGTQVRTEATGWVDVTFLGLQRVVLLSSLTLVALALCYHRESLVSMLGLLIPALPVGVVLALWVCRVRLWGAWWAVLAIVVTLAVVFLFSSLPAGPETDWLVMGFAAMSGTIGFRLSPAWSLVLTGILSTGLILTELARGGGPTWATMVALMGIGAISGGSVWLRQLLRAADAQVTAAGLVDARIRYDALRSLAHQEELAQRRAAFREVVLPLLGSIRDRRLTEPQQRSQALRIEAAIRDLIVARPLLDQAMVDAIEAARSRGARVEVAATDPAGDYAAAVESVLREVLRYASSGSFVRAIVTTAAGVRTGSVVAMGLHPDGTDLLLGNLALQRLVEPLTVSHLEEENLILVEVSPVPTDAPRLSAPVREERELPLPTIRRVGAAHIE